MTSQPASLVAATNAIISSTANTYTMTFTVEAPIGDETVISVITLTDPDQEIWDIYLSGEHAWLFKVDYSNDNKTATLKFNTADPNLDVGAILDDLDLTIEIETFDDDDDYVQTATATIHEDHPPTAINLSLTSDGTTLSTEGTGVDEGAGVTTARHLATVEFTDDGHGVNTAVLADNPGGLFEILNGNELWLVAGKSLDAETALSHTVTVQAARNSAATATFTLQVDDVDEFAPEFTGGAIAFSINENAEADPNVVLATVRATDRDAKANDNDITYAFANGSQTSNGLTINSTTGAITHTGAPFDHEATSEVVLEVVATSGGRTATTTMTLTVIDINESPYPTTNPFAFSIDENMPANTVVGTVSGIIDPEGIALDRHGNENIRWSMVGSSEEFSIDSRTGTITTLMAFDHETQSSYTIQVRARVEDSQGNREYTDPITVTIGINDVDEFAPEFLGGPYAFSIDENAPADSSVVRVQVRATDRDGTANDADITYAFEDGSLTSGEFTINASTGAITHTGQPLDHEAGETLSLSVKATSGARSSTTTVTVTVNDINERPYIAEPDVGIVFSVAENMPGNSQVGSMAGMVLDPEGVASDRSENPDVRWYIVGSSEDFRIDSRTGVITTLRSLDHETKSSHTVQIRARVRDSQGERDYTTPVTVIVNVDDEDEHKPEFTRSFTFTVNENSRAGSLLGTVSGTDADATDIVTFSFGGREREYEGFRINGHTGQIFVPDGLDHETTPQIVLTVYAASNNKKTATDITVVVNNVNEASPAGDIELSVSEGGVYQNTALGIGLVDPEGEALTFVSSQSGTTTNGSWSVDASGRLTYTPNSDFSGKEVFEVEVRDPNAETGTAKIAMTVIDADITIEGVFRDSEDSWLPDPTGTIRVAAPVPNPSAYTILKIDNEADAVAAATISADGTRVDGEYGTLIVDIDGDWTYQLDDTKPALEALDGNSQTTETFKVAMARPDTPTQQLTADLVIEIQGRTDVRMAGFHDSNFRYHYGDSYYSSLGYTDGPTRWADWDRGEETQAIHGNEKTNIVRGGPNSDVTFTFGGADSVYHNRGGVDWTDTGAGNDNVTIGSQSGHGSAFDGGPDTDLLRINNYWATDGTWYVNLFDRKQYSVDAVGVWSEATAEEIAAGGTFTRIWRDDNVTGQADEGDIFMYVRSFERLIMFNHDGVDYEIEPGRFEIFLDLPASGRLIDGGTSVLLGSGYDNDFVLRHLASQAEPVLDVVVNFGHGNDKIRVDTPQGTEATLQEIKDALKIRWDNSGNYDTGTESNDANINDTVIYYTGGSGPDVPIMVLEDYNEDLTMAQFEVV